MFGLRLRAIWPRDDVREPRCRIPATSGHETNLTLCRGLQFVKGGIMHIGY